MKTKLLLLSLAFVSTVLAGNSTWSSNPLTNDWNTATNWVPNQVPDSPDDTAIFDLSALTSLSVSQDIDVGALTFDVGASAYTITPAAGVTMTISGAGISNQSGVTQTFVLPGDSDIGITFTGSAKAGTMTLFSNHTGVLSFPGGVTFNGTSSADHATIINEGAADESSIDAGVTTFNDNSNVENATIINNAGLHGGGETLFQFTSTAGNSTIICNSGTAPMMRGGVVSMGGTGQYGGNSTITVNGSDVAHSGGGLLDVFDHASTGNATLIANGGALDPGHLQFQPAGSGGTSRVELFGNGSLDILYPAGEPPLTIGSLEGDGSVFLDAANLMIGGNGLSTIFSGVIADEGGGGSITKVGAGTLTLSGANTYTGGTVVRGGTLLVNNPTGSATGTGLVKVANATLAGSGTLAGPVTMQNGGLLTPSAGAKFKTTLTIQGLLTLSSTSTYTYTFKANKNQAHTDLVIANGAAIKNAILNLSGQTNGSLTFGLTLTVISNTSASPISGTFSNLPEGAIVTVNGNNLQASYSGGDGNDLTLTVVP